ncbi:DUF4123 domain-containing protein [Vreelandella boliviensis]|uniref:DUF4123 domain-containing protein n=1 Tax=Vreelandella boliviensis LC1 TaxID=1072583 RepID=A0A265DWH2_9GAMM|nr:DUF4123 domain-containing protein [Halomonas boliviensis]EHJ92589.1 hypothetical protein KUC_2546 [Halomonas boliviensis LC1]OZT73667.1 DUF4123 domain-containing protein [Halomonas boliviensis LC1]
MRVIQANTLSQLLNQNNGLQHWLVLEENGKTLSSLYRQLQSVDFDWLFLQTRYKDFLKRSPILMPLNQATKGILETFSEDPRKGIAPGVIIASRAPRNEVLAHLRSCLEVTFYGNRKGMLRFYHPDIAAALFSQPEGVSRQWFGPIAQWIWQGDEIGAKPTASPLWQALEADDQTDESVLAPDQVLQLTRHQEQALERYIRLTRAFKQYRSPGESLDDMEVRQNFLNSDTAQQALFPAKNLNPVSATAESTV